MIDLNVLANRAYKAIERRKANGAALSPTDFVGALKHTENEIVEALDAWLIDGDIVAATSKLSNVMVHCLIASHSLKDCDIEGALLDAIEYNEAKAGLQGDNAQ